MDQSSLSVAAGNAAAAPQTLSRSLSPRHVTMISMGGMIGAGVFVGSSAAIAAVGPAIVLSYLIAGVLILLVMRMLAEMATALPNVRTFTEFARAGLGPAAGFVVGWLYWYFWIITVAVEAIAGANLLHLWIALPTWLLGVVLIAIMTGVNLMSARSFGEFEFWFASIKVAAIIIFIALAGGYASGLLSPNGATWSNLVSHGGFMPKGAVAVLAGVTTVFFSLTGAEITTVAAAESRDPTRALTKMTTSVITRIVIFYVGSIFLIVAVVPWDSIVPGQSPFTHALLAMRFSWAGSAMSLIILTAVLSCLNSAFYVTSRVLFTLAEHRDAPQWMVKLNARHVPARSVLAGTAAGLIGVFAAVWSPGGVFAFLVNASGALILYVYMLTAIAQIRLRRGVDPSTLRLKMWWFPWSSYAAIAGIVAVLLAMALTKSLQSEFYVSLTTLAVSLCAYALTAYQRSRRLLSELTSS
jgi:L-asparagine transporter-like permease